MIVCEKCGCDNAISAVHCLKCGALLSHFSDNEKPKKSTVKNDTTSWCYSNNDLSIVLVKSIIGLSIYALIIVLTLMLWPNFNNNDIELSKANAAFKKAKLASYSRRFELQCNESELAAVIRLGLPSFFVQGASFGNVVARDVMVEFTGPQSFDVIVTYNAINGVIPFDVSYSVALPSKGVPPYKLSVNKTGFGLLPVPSTLISPLVSSATKALKKSKLTVLLSRIKWGKIEDGKLTVYSQINI